MVLLEFIENQENTRKINRAEALAASGTIENHRKSFKFLPNSFQISIWASLGLSKPLKSWPRESGLPKPEKSRKIIEKWKDVDLHERKPLQNDAEYYFFVFWTGLEWFTAHFYTLLAFFMFFHRLETVVLIWHRFGIQSSSCYVFFFKCLRCSIVRSLVGK